MGASVLFRQLEYFVAVADERHFARAAEACYASQPALSAGLARLEQELGVALVKRGHSFQGLTPEGERLVPWARELVLGHEQFKAEAKAMTLDVGGTLRLCIGPTAAAVSVLPVRAFCAANPQVRVRLVEGLAAQEIQRRLREFEFGAAIAYLPPGFRDGLDIRPLYTDRYVLVATADLVPPEVDSLTWADAAALPLILLGGQMRLRSLIDEAFAGHGLAADPRIETDSIAALAAYAETGQWASVLPHTCLLPDPGPLRMIPLTDPVVTADIVLATASDARDWAITKAFAAAATGLGLGRRLRFAG